MLSRTGETIQPINLAHAAPFRLGEIAVHPATRQLIRGGHSETLEPRVMQVLVALAGAEGAVVTRDELTDLCWDGRIVSENALNRVISRLRQIAADFAAGAFELETITKVGYRLYVTGPGAPAIVGDASSAPTPASGAASGVEPKQGSRRAFLGRITAVTALTAGGLAYGLSATSRGSSPASAAADYYEKGVAARSLGLANMMGQAEAYFAQAVEIDPSFAEAWAALALARAGQVSFEQGDNQQTMAARARSAAGRALQIDPGSVEARTALAFVPTAFGRWAEAQAEYRQLLSSPRRTRHVEWLLRARLAYCLGEVGRCREALQVFRPAANIYPSHPYSSVGLTQALWNAGAVGEAEAESSRALLRFPRHPDIWFTRMALLTYGSRPELAVAFGNDRTQWPFRETGEGLLFRRIKTAQALASLKPDDIEHAVRLHRSSVAADWSEIPAAARFFAALGRLDTAFELLWGYYRNRGDYADPNRPAPGPYTRFAVVDLFWPPMAPLWPDPRFGQLAEEIGLAAYWRATGSEPDFRRRLARA